MNTPITQEDRILVLTSMLDGSIKTHKIIHK